MDFRDGKCFVIRASVSAIAVVRMTKRGFMGIWSVKGGSNRPRRYDPAIFPLPTNQWHISIPAFTVEIRAADTRSETASRPSTRHPERGGGLLATERHSKASYYFGRAVRLSDSRSRSFPLRPRRFHALIAHFQVKCKDNEAVPSQL